MNICEINELIKPCLLMKFLARIQRYPTVFLSPVFHQMSPDIKCSDLERELISGFFVLTTETHRIWCIDKVQVFWKKELKFEGEHVDEHSLDLHIVI